MASADTLVVVLARPATSAEPVLAVVRSWARAGLLGTSFWPDVGADTQRLEGELLERDEGTRRARLTDVIAAAPYATVRIVSVRLLADPTGLKVADINDEADAVATFVDGLLSQGRQVLERLNLLVPAAGTEEMPFDLVRRSWPANVVAAAEDRLDARHADRLITLDRGYAEHAAMALVTNAGLWADIPSPLPHLATHQTQHTSTVRVTRAFGRVLFGDDVVGDIADGVVAALHDPTVVASWRGLEVETDAEAATREVVDHHLEPSDSPFHHQAAPPPEPVRPVAIGPWASLTMFWAFLVRHLKRLPARIANKVVDGVQRRIEGYVQSVTFGADSTYRVSMSGRPSDDLPAVTIPDMAAEVLRHSRSRAANGVPGDDWSGARRALLQLVDPSIRHQSAAVVLDRRFVAPPSRWDPMLHGDAPDSLPKPVRERFDTPTHPCDPRLYREITELLRQHRSELVTSLTTLDSEGEPNEQRSAQIQRSVEAADEALEAVEAWAEPRRPSGTWRVGEVLDDARIAAESAFTGALQAVIDGRPTIDPVLEEKRTWRRVKRAAMAFGLGGVVGAVAGSAWSAWMLLTIPLMILSWLLYGLRQVRKLFQSRHRFDREWHRYQAALDALPHEAGEVMRLGTAYEQFLDWSLLVGTLVHPVDAPPTSTEPLDVEAIPHPAALELVLAKGDPLGCTGTVARAGRRVFAAGWLERYFVDALRHAQERVGLEVGLDPSSVDANLFSGVHQGRLRGAALDELTSGRTADRWRRSALAEVRHTVGKQPVTTLFPTIEGVHGQTPTGRFFEALVPRPEFDGGESFALPIWTAEGLAEESLRVQHVDVEGPVVLTDTPDGADYVAVMIRFDVSEELLADRLRLFETPTLSTDGPVSLDREDIG